LPKLEPGLCEAERLSPLLTSTDRPLLVSTAPTTPSVTLSREERDLTPRVNSVPFTTAARNGVCTEKWWRSFLRTVALTVPFPWNRTVMPSGNSCAGTFTRLRDFRITVPSSVAIIARLPRPAQTESPGRSA
jgi:hypothetical protein